MISLLISGIIVSCKMKKSADDEPQVTICPDADPVLRMVTYDSLWQWGVPHVDSVEGGLRVFTAKWDVPTMMCPQDSVRLNIRCYMTTNQIRPITLRCYLEFQFGQEHNEPVPLTETDGIWSNLGNPEPWVFLPAPYYKGSEVGYIVVHVDYLVPRTEEFFDDLNYLYANAQDVIISCDFTGWPSK